MVILLDFTRSAPDDDGKPGPWGPLEPFCLATGDTPGDQAPYSWKDGDVKRWGQHCVRECEVTVREPERGEL